MLLDADLSLFLGTSSVREKGFLRVFSTIRGIELVLRTQRSAISAFTRVFDALWLLRSGALQNRGRNGYRCLVPSRLCGAA
jgi:hypothetical protein